MAGLHRGRYRARLALGEADLARALTLRQHSFRTADPRSDADRFDPLCRHVLIEDAGTGSAGTGSLVCCFRLLRIEPGESLEGSYAGQFYDLTALQGFDGARLELGRFCIAADRHDPDILRLAWGAITAIVDAEAIGLLFGCSSFVGADPDLHQTALRALRQHLAPSLWHIGVKSDQTYPFSAALSGPPTDLRAAMAAMPPLLRTYLAMGGWVSDHAVIDHDLNTLHVFTAVEIARIPPARARALRMVAQGHAAD